METLCDLVLLAAGNSQRMGKAKALLPYGSNEFFFEHIVNIYNQFGVQKIAMVVQPELKKHLESSPERLAKNLLLVENSEPQKGRIYSIKLGLQFLNSQLAFIHNIDNPFVDKNLLKAMLAALKKNSYVSPNFKGKGGHPLLFSQEIIQAVQQETLPDDMHLKKYLTTFSKKILPVGNQQILININTPDEYQQYFKEI